MKVSLAILVDSGRLLLIRRSKNPYLGLWSLPGGKVDTGETSLKAVKREVEEETSLRGLKFRYLGRVIEMLNGNEPETDFEHDISIYTATVPDEFAKKPRKRNLKWFRYGELGDLANAIIPTDFMIINNMYFSHHKGKYWVDAAKVSGGYIIKNIRELKKR